MRQRSLAPLRLPAYRRLFSAYSVNNLGDWVGEIALSVLVLHATDSVLAVTALWVLGRFVPALLAPLTVSAVERRLGAARPLRGLHLIEAALFGLVAAATGAGAPVVLILGLAFVDGIVSSTARALLKTAVVATTRPHELLREGNALLGVAFTGTVAIGPLLGGAVVALFGVPAALVMDAVSFAFAALVLGPGARLPVVARDDAEADRLRAGFAHLWRHRELRVLTLADAAAGVFFAAIIPVELVFVTQTLGGTEADFGAVLAAWGVGAVLGSAAVSVFPRLGPRTLLLAGVGLCIAGYLGMGTAAAVAAVVTWSFVGGIGNGLEGVVLTTFIQERTPDALQARINAVVEALHTGAPGLGFLLGGVVAATASPRAAYWFAAVGALAVTAIAVAALLRPAPRTTPVYA
jgi:MFS family permease